MTTHPLQSLDKDGVMPKDKYIENDRPQCECLSPHYFSKGFNESNAQHRTLGVEWQKDIFKKALVDSCWEFNTRITRVVFTDEELEHIFQAISQNPQILRLVKVAE